MNTKKNFVNLIAGIMAALTIMSFAAALPTYANSKNLTPSSIEAAFEAPMQQMMIFHRKPRIIK